MAKPKKPVPSKKAAKAAPKAKGKASKAAPKKKAKPAAKPVKRQAPKGTRVKASPPQARKRERVRVPRLSPAELQTRLTVARDAAANRPLRKQWERAMERMRNHLSDAAGIECQLRIASPPKTVKGTPWAMVARFGSFGGALTWRTAYHGLSATEQDDRIEDLIGKARLCRIGAKYNGVETRGGDPSRTITREFTLSEIAPWPFCISRAVERTDVNSEESLASLYPDTEVIALYVWISLDEARGKSVTLAT